MAAKPGGGNVGISRFRRDFQGTVERAGKLLLLFRAFHSPVISTALSRAATGARATIYCTFRSACLFRLYRARSGDSLLHRRSNSALAAAILRAHSVSLIFPANRSSWAMLTCFFKYCCTFSTCRSFSYGVA